MAKHPESFGIALANQPVVDFCAAVQVFFSSVFATTAIDMVYAKKLLVLFAAAIAAAAVVLDDLLFNFLSALFGPGILGLPEPWPSPYFAGGIANPSSPPISTELVAVQSSTFFVHLLRRPVGLIRQRLVADLARPFGFHGMNYSTPVVVH
jgi:hypothetical protein